MNSRIAFRHLACQVDSVTENCGGDPTGWGAARDRVRSTDGPTVSVGIPTFNRAEQLRRAVGSCQAQTYPHIEILISDNASTDDTRDLCRQWQAQDSRISTIRQERNIGREPNFGAVLRLASSEFFMWLSDDDWLDPAYIESCVAAFTRQPYCSIVGGVARYTSHCGGTRDEQSPPIDQPEPSARVLAYLSSVVLNGEYYGLMRRRDMVRCGYPVTLAGDWYFVAQMAALGPILTITGPVVHRSPAGASLDMAGLAESYGLPSHWGRDAHLWALFLVVPALALGRGSFGVATPVARTWDSLRLARTLFARWWRQTGRLRLRIDGIARTRGALVGYLRGSSHF